MNEALAVYVSNEKIYDLKLFQDSNIHITQNTMQFEDLGFLWLKHKDPNTKLSIKKSKNQSLSKENKKKNIELSKIRVNKN